MRYILAILFCLVAFPAYSQVNPVSAGQPLDVGFDHTGQNVTGFQCHVDGKPTGDVQPATGRVCHISGQPEGPHSVTVEAINAFGRAMSLPLTVTAGTPPEPPTNLQITMTIVVQPNGTVELLAFHVQKQ